ncbi:MAG: phage terminase large subunit [Panacagrimonas sp.]
MFLWLVWRHLGLPAPTAVQLDIAYFLQHGPRRSIIEAFRGVGKSWITGAFVIWLLYRNPDEKILVVSASKVRADDLSTFCLRLIEEIPLLSHLKPRGDQRNSKIAFDVGASRTSKDPSVKSVGITGQLTGSRASIIIPDDIEVPSNSLTQAQRDKLSELVKEFDAILSPGGRIIYLGTPQVEQSLYNTLATRGYTVRIWPVRYPKPDKMLGNYAEWLAPWIKGPLEKDPALALQPVEPLRFPEEDLQERQASYGRAGFALQFMLDTSLSDADLYPLKLKDLIVMTCDTERAPLSVAYGDNRIEGLEQIGMNGDKWLGPIFVEQQYGPYTGAVCYVDPSGRGKDETSWAIVKILHGWLYLMRVGGSLNGYDEGTLRAIAEDCKRFKVNHVLCEPNFGDGMFTKMLIPVMRNIYPCLVEDAERSAGQKERRVIDILEPLMQSHRLVVDRKVVEDDQALRYPDISPDQRLKYRLFYQLTRLTAEKGALSHDDRVEAVAGACRYWVDQMGIDQKAKVEEFKEEALRATLESFMDHALGRQRSDHRNAFASIVDPVSA